MVIFSKGGVEAVIVLENHLPSKKARAVEDVAEPAPFTITELNN